MPYNYAECIELLAAALHAGHIDIVRREAPPPPDLPHRPADQVQERQTDQGGQGHAISARQVVRQSRQGDVRARPQARRRIPAPNNR